MGVFSRSGPGVRFGEARVAAVAASAVVIGLFGAGHLVGRSAGWGAAPDTAAHTDAPVASVGGGPEESAPPPSAAPPPFAPPTSASAPSTPGASATAEPGRGNDAAAVLAVPPSTERVTGPGRPPLSMPGTGPHGTRRTTGTGSVALTFDDGPDPRWTPEVLRLLRKHRVRATFCVVGELVEAYPQLVADIAAAGHTLCNHSWDHDFGLAGRPRQAIRDDLERTNRAIRAAVPGARVSYYRQPGGAWTRRVVEVAAELGMSSLHWAVDPQDWRRPGAGAIAAEVRSSTVAGAIVLLHDGGGDRRDTVVALRRLLPGLADRLDLAALPPGADPPRRRGFRVPLKPDRG